MDTERTINAKLVYDQWYEKASLLAVQRERLGNFDVNRPEGERNQWYGRGFCPHPDSECIDGCSFCGAKLRVNDHNHTLQQRNPDRYECVCFNC